MLLAGMTKSPALMLTETEARALAEATVNVSRHYPQFQAAQKTIDWVNLGTILVLTYGTRMVAASKRKKEERAAQGQNQNGADVVTLHPQPAS